MSAEIHNYDVPELGPPLGQYRHVCRVRSQELLFIAGMLATDGTGKSVGQGDFEGQTAQVFRNIYAALRSAGAEWRNVVQFTTYLVHSRDLRPFFELRRQHFLQMFPDGVYPPNTLLIVDRLVREEFLIEIQTVAAL